MMPAQRHISAVRLPSTPQLRHFFQLFQDTASPEMRVSSLMPLMARTTLRSNVRPTVRYASISMLLLMRSFFAATPSPSAASAQMTRPMPVKHAQSFSSLLTFATFSVLRRQFGTPHARVGRRCAHVARPLPPYRQSAAAAAFCPPCRRDARYRAAAALLSAVRESPAQCRGAQSVSAGSVHACCRLLHEVIYSAFETPAAVYTSALLMPMHARPHASARGSDAAMAIFQPAAMPGLPSMSASARTRRVPPAPGHSFLMLIARRSGVPSLHYFRHRYRPFI